MVDKQNQERRLFSRIPFDAVAHLHARGGDLYLNCKVIDVSLKGLLVARPEHWQGEPGEHYHVDLLLEQGEIVIQMQATVAHIDEHNVGFACELIDLDSITHLKRLVELNLGDEGLLHRELSALLDKD